MEPTNASLEDRLESARAKYKNQVFVFSGQTLDLALDEWEAEQIAAYPHKEELIRITALAMRDFLGSDQVSRHKMTMPASARK